MSNEHGTFINDEVHLNDVEKILGQCGRMLSGSKSGYRNKYPNNVVGFNCNIVANGVKVWYGDVDVTKDIDKLKKIANVLKTDIYVINEMDGRFENEHSPKLDNPIAVIKRK